MHDRRRRIQRASAIAPRAAILVLAAFGLACSERSPSGPGRPPAATGPLLTCQVDMGAQTLSCGNPNTSPDLILGGQGMYVQLRSSNVSYDASTQIFRADVTVQNLTALNLGTPDGSTVTGVRVFFYSGPTVTSGSGTVTVANPDGTGTFTGTNQPYFLYNEILPTGQVSSGRTWQWSVPSTVTFFTFQVLVDAAVQDFFMLTVSVLGGGTVTSAPVGISCAAANTGMCSARFLSGASVTLSPNTAPGWAFSIAGWGGDCAGSGGSATLVMTQNRNCSVAFAPELTVSIAGSGTITSSPAGINCTSGNSGVCGTTFLFGTAVTLMATPASGRVFAGWSGDCTGTGDCMVLMSNVRRVGATFLSATGPATLVIGPKPLIIEVGAHPNIDVVVKDADGTVISNPTVTFASRNPLVAAFSPGGVLNGLARGQSVIVATASGGSAPADSLLAVVAVPGGPVVITDITQFNYGVGNNLTVTLIVDMRDSGELLGSTTVDMGWDPSLMTFQSYATASSGVSPIVNALRAGSGLLTVSMADPNGFAGKVELVKITFAASPFPRTGALSLTPTEITGAGTYADLLPNTVAASYPLAILTVVTAAGHPAAR